MDFKHAKSIRYFFLFHSPSGIPIFILNTRLQIIRALLINYVARKWIETCLPLCFQKYLKTCGSDGILNFLKESLSSRKKFRKIVDLFVSRIQIVYIGVNLCNRRIKFIFVGVFLKNAIFKISIITSFCNRFDWN